MTDNTPKNGTTQGAKPTASAAPPTPISPFEQAAAPEGHAKTVSAVLGEIVWLMSQSTAHKQFFISDLEWLVMTPAEPACARRTGKAATGCGLSK